MRPSLAFAAGASATKGKLGRLASATIANAEPEPSHGGR